MEEENKQEENLPLKIRTRCDSSDSHQIWVRFLSNPKSTNQARGLQSLNMEGGTINGDGWCSWMKKLGFLVLTFAFWRKKKGERSLL
ncbi:hypothetical protein KY285_024816 [Solanum tuberosum]|nr:hypothetical protein KY289_025023 [Solanum tuberosum]KAH0677015.1 hypothetical protein KY285_024816 [Solanum tuberosum]